MNYAIGHPARLAVFGRRIGAGHAPANLRMLACSATCDRIAMIDALAVAFGVARLATIVQFSRATFSRWRESETTAPE